MSAFDYYPDSFPSVLFDSRQQPGGLYSHIVDIVSNMGKGALCNVNIDADFFRRRRLDNWTNNYGFRTEGNAEFNANVFGEIVGEQYGTLLGATGNHYPGRPDEEPKLITDSTHVKPVIVLGKPSLCNEVLGDYYHDQIVVFNDIRRVDRRDEEQENQEFDIKEAIRGKEVEDSEPCLIILHGQPIYTVERESSGTGFPKPRERVMTKRRANGAPAYQPSSAVADSTANVSSSVIQDARVGRPLEEAELPGLEAVRVGAKYSPWVLPGYGGPRFQQRLARAIQPDWRDAGGQLIPVWNIWNVLRPGTVIMANVVINVYVMPGSKGKRRKVYQASIQSLRVLGRSDVPVDKPQADFTEFENDRAQEQVNDEPSLALRNLVLPDELGDANEGSVDGSSVVSSGPRSGNHDAGSSNTDPGARVAGPSTATQGTSEVLQQGDASMEFLEDTETQFMSNTRRGKKARRN
ncbi:hypothetical protein V5O48_007163 [Marasmius crinis-equi]|uniref:Uncharacterized protein n=1 Tax=Marasmius crinis-equi TaxID=585013 RepID=A0ABR3FHH2_9AGAR